MSKNTILIGYVLVSTVLVAAWIEISPWIGVPIAVAVGAFAAWIYQSDRRDRAELNALWSDEDRLWACLADHLVLKRRAEDDRRRSLVN